MTLAESFGYVHELDPTKQGIESILEELDAVEVFWNYTSRALQLLEELLNTPWGEVDAPTIEQDVKTLQKGLKDLKVSHSSQPPSIHPYIDIYRYKFTCKEREKLSTYVYLCIEMYLCVSLFGSG